MYLYVWFKYRVIRVVFCKFTIHPYIFPGTSQLFDLRKSSCGSSSGKKSNGNELLRNSTDCRSAALRRAQLLSPFTFLAERWILGRVGQLENSPSLPRAIGLDMLICFDHLLCAHQRSCARACVGTFEPPSQIHMFYQNHLKWHNGKDTISQHFPDDFLWNGLLLSESAAGASCDK